MGRNWGGMPVTPESVWIQISYGRGLKTKNKTPFFLNNKKEERVII
jgi:hypothetical protein